MAQVHYLSNQNQSTPYNDLGSIKINTFNSKLPTNRSKVDNLQCIYFRREHSRRTLNNPNQANNNQTPAEYSYENESNSVSNVLRWLNSLPPNFMMDLEKNTNFDKSEGAPNLNQCTRRIRDKRSKSLEFSLKSTGDIPLEGKRRILTGRNQKVNFKMDTTPVECATRKRKCCKDVSNSRLSKKSATSDLHALVKTQEDMCNDDRCQQRVGILKTGPNGRRRMMERKISSNRRLLHSIKEIISTVEEDERMNLRPRRVKKKEDKTVLISSKIKVARNAPRKPIFKNPEIEKTLDDAMRNTLKRYVHWNNWDDFKNNNYSDNILYGEPPVKKEKRAIPSLTPVDSSDIDLSPIWNTNPVFSNIRTF